MSNVVPLPRATPESQGIPSDAIRRWVEAMDGLASPHSFMLLRHGKVIAEGWWKPYAPDVPHQLFSLSKSFASLAVGFAAAEGRLSLDDRVAGFFPDKRPANPDERFQRLTLRHLLTMSDGHDRCAMTFMEADPDGDWVRGYLASALPLEPGSRFVYNSGATYMLSAIVRSVTGLNLTEYLAPRLFDRIGIANRRWETCPRGTEIGGWGFELTTGEIASFAQLLLDGGRRDGCQILPPAYLAEATARQIDNSMNDQPDWKVGYGFQFWRSHHNAFRGDGAFGQYALVMPEQDACLAITAGVAGMQEILTRVWDELLPAMGKGALPEAPERVAALTLRSAGLRIPTVAKAPVAAMASQVSGRTYRLSSNRFGFKAIAFACRPDGCAMTITMDQGKETLSAGYAADIDNRVKFGYPRHRRGAARAAWTGDDTLQIAVCFYETPFQVRFICRFSGEIATVQRQSNLLFREGEWPLLEGRAPESAGQSGRPAQVDGGHGAP